MQVSLLLGFLGAGKTTLLQNILEHGVGDERVAVIVNEFGAVGVDGDILAGRALDTIELASGCICCSLKVPLLEAIDELAETVAPDRLLIEASGVAQPDDVASALGGPAMAGIVEIAPVITVVDAARFRRMASSLGSFYAEQVERADIVIINKIDLASAEEVEAVQSEVAGLNPSARIEFAERCDLDIGHLLRGGSHFQGGHQAEKPTNHDHTKLISFVFDSISNWSHENITSKFAQLPKAVLRVKGYVRIDGQSQLVQYVPGALETTPVASRERHYLVVIGQDLDRASLAALFEA